MPESRILKYDSESAEKEEILYRDILEELQRTDDPENIVFLTSSNIRKKRLLSFLFRNNYSFSPLIVTRLTPYLVHQLNITDPILNPFQTKFLLYSLSSSYKKDITDLQLISLAEIWLMLLSQTDRPVKFKDKSFPCRYREVPLIITEDMVTHDCIYNVFEILSDLSEIQSVSYLDIIRNTASGLPEESLWFCDTFSTLSSYLSKLLRIISNNVMKFSYYTPFKENSLECRNCISMPTSRRITQNLYFRDFLTPAEEINHAKDILSTLDMQETIIVASDIEVYLPYLRLMGEIEVYKGNELSQFWPFWNILGNDATIKDLKIFIDFPSWEILDNTEKHELKTEIKKKLQREPVLNFLERFTSGSLHEISVLREATGIELINGIICFFEKYFRPKIEKEYDSYMILRKKLNDLLDKRLLENLDNLDVVMLPVLAEEEKDNSDIARIAGIPVYSMEDALNLNAENLIFLGASVELFPKTQKSIPYAKDELLNLLGMSNSRKSIEIQVSTFENLIRGYRNVYFSCFKCDLSGNHFLKSPLLQGMDLKKADPVIFSLNRNSSRNPERALKLKNIDIKRKSNKDDNINLWNDFIKTDELKTDMDLNIARWSTMISPTSLERYANCPYKFFLYDLIKLHEPMQDEEEWDKRSEGILIHEVLRIFYEKFINRKISSIEEKDWQGLRRIFESEISKLNMEPIQQRILEKQWLHENSLLDQFIMIEKAYKPERIVFALEREVEYTMEADQSDKVTLKGKIDRIDMINEQNFIIFDYKTGKTKTDRISKKIKNNEFLQIPAYSYIFEKTAKNSNIIDSYIYSLSEKAFLFNISRIISDCIVNNENETISSPSKYFEYAFRIIYDDIKSRKFKPVKGKHENRSCGYCSYSPVCPYFKDTGY
ncbi:MAG: PD-(D/E)XK nuclease family protein [Candidatus Coatesbacteria bacterium]|nr:PD-(D/E)XK nuclease family protein [Candidatus Coatesbacteria bacterium]